MEILEFIEAHQHQVPGLFVARCVALFCLVATFEQSDPRLQALRQVTPKLMHTKILALERRLFHHVSYHGACLTYFFVRQGRMNQKHQRSLT